jgi:hypothetical protein
VFPAMGSRNWKGTCSEIMVWIDMVVDRGNHLIWRSQDLNKEMSCSCRLHADQVPGGVVTKLDECSQDVYRQRAAATRFKYKIKINLG